MNSIEIGLHVGWIGDLIGIAAALPSCFPQDEWGVLESEGIEGVAKQRFIGNQSLQLLLWCPLGVPAVVEEAGVGVHIDVVQLLEQFGSLLPPEAAVGPQGFAGKVVGDRQVCVVAQMLHVLTNLAH